MNHTKQFWISALALFAAALVPLQAQRSAAPNDKTSRAERTAQFLGLGEAPDSAAAERGAKLFSSNCAFCHGAKATGAEGPDLVRSALVLHDEKGNLIGPVVLKGRPGQGMPSFASFTQDQIYEIAEFLHMRVYLAANRGLYKVQNVVTGDAKAGEAFFNGEGHCNTCHSPSGDLAHIASKYPPVDLQAAFLYPAAVDRSIGRDLPVTVTLPSGQSVSGTLKRLDDFNVSLYDASGQYHSWPRGDGIKVEVKDPLQAHRELLAKYTDADMHNVLAYLVTLK